MSRSKWKGPVITFIDNKRDKNVRNIWNKNETICSSRLNSRVLVYNGQKFTSLFINQPKLGLKFGEFCFTRKKGSKVAKKTKKK